MIHKFLVQVESDERTRNLPDVERMRAGIRETAARWLHLATDGPVPLVTCIREEEIAPLAPGENGIRGGIPAAQSEQESKPRRWVPCDFCGGVGSYDTKFTELPLNTEPVGRVKCKQCKGTGSVEYQPPVPVIGERTEIP